MPQSLAKVYLHLVYSTKHRQRILDDTIRPSLHAYVGGILKNLHCHPLEINSEPDHIHVLHELSRTIQIAQVVNTLKKGSTLWIREQQPELAVFSWQSGYGAFSIGRSEIDAVRFYIQNQQLHHRGCDYKEEFRGLCKEFGVAWDERYVWD